MSQPTESCVDPPGCIASYLGTVGFDLIENLVRGMRSSPQVGPGVRTGGPGPGPGARGRGPGTGAWGPGARTRGLKPGPGARGPGPGASKV